MLFRMQIVTSTPHSVAPTSPASWRESLRAAIRSPAELCAFLRLDPAALGVSAAAENGFPLLVTREYAGRMQPGNPHDPLLRQVLPVAEETHAVAGFGTDPVGDAAAGIAAGVLHKYHGRALLIATGACAIHCRYCFRRHYPYSEGPRSLTEWEPSVAAIEADRSISEVILSGGDPLMLTDERLAALVARLEQVSHLKRLRIHTRLPIMIPARVTDRLLEMLAASRLQAIVVIHANHAAEIDSATAAALGRLADAGALLLNQAVLLAGVNDSVEALADLCQRMIDLRVMPYYLHQLDRVAGAAHFEVPEERGRAIMNELRSLLPGYAVPQYVREVAGEPGKVPV